MIGNLFQKKKSSTEFPFSPVPVAGYLHRLKNSKVQNQSQSQILLTMESDKFNSKKSVSDSSEHGRYN